MSVKTLTIDIEAYTLPSTVLIYLLFVPHQYYVISIIYLRNRA